MAPVTPVAQLHGFSQAPRLKKEGNLRCDNDTMVSEDVVNYNSLITTCLGSSSWQLAVHVLAHMPVSPDSISRLAAQPVSSNRIARE